MTLSWLAPSDAIALTDALSGETLSYRRLVDRADEVGSRLGESKHLVFLLCRNDTFTAVAYAGTQRAGHAVALLDGARPAGDHVPVLRAYQPDWILGPTGTGAALEAAGVTPAQVDVVAGGEIVRPVPRVGSAAAVSLHPDLAVMLSTSGTTGSSKYVRLSARNVAANATSIAEYIGITPRERPVTSLPLHYSFGLSVLNSHWLAGANVVLSTQTVIQRPFWEAVERHACTSFAGVPYTYQMLERVGYREMDLPSLMTMQQAGGALDRQLTQTYADHMRRRGGRFFVMYGQTEATARIAYVPPERLSDKLGSAGIAIPGGQLRIEDGEVVYEGANVMLGYAEERSHLAAGDEYGGVLRTGDMGYLDDEGYLFLTGRSKRIAKVFGLRVNLDEIETILRESGPAAVVAGEGGIIGFCAFGTEASIADLRSSLARRLRIHPSALNLRRVTDVPVTSSGKIDYHEVERWITD